MKAGVGLFAGQRIAEKMIDSAARFAEASVGYGYAIPMLRPRPVQLALKVTGGIRNLYVLRHFLPDPRIWYLWVSPLFSITYALD